MRTTRAAPREIRGVIRACSPVVKHKLHATSLIACGAQGCVYRTASPKRVVKVTAGDPLDVGGTEAERYLWIKKLGWADGHTALPYGRRVRVFKLNDCAREAGSDDAFAVEREALADVPRNAATKRAIKVLRTLEDRLADAGTRRRFSFAQVKRIITDHLCTLSPQTCTLIGQSTIATAMLFQIAHLQVWLAFRGLTMRDLKLSNLGIRRPGIWGSRFEVVMRDIGLLEKLNEPTSERQRRFFKHRAPPRLGSPPLDAR
jgi:hypothetical protein